ncbi:hypothetical protein Tco_0405120 [Tanacetum coccineum]
MAVKKKKENKEKVMKTSKRRSVFKQGRKTIKSSKGAPTVPTNTEWDDLDMNIDDTIKYTLAQDEGKTDKIDEKGESTTQQQSTDRQDEGTDMPKVSTDRTKLSTDKDEEGTAETEPIESTSSSTQTTPTPTPTTFGDDETIAQVLLNMSQAKAIAHDEEVARKMQEEWEAEEERKRLIEEEATKTVLSNEYDFIQARIESDRLLALILGDLKSAVQTRRKLTKSSRAHAFVSYIQKQRRNNHKDFQHCLFACFLSQNEPKKISKALEDEGIKLILWGDLKIMMESSIEVTDQGDFWNDQQDWEIVTWRLYETCGVCILEFKDGTVIHMLVERRYPLSKDLLQRMLDFGLEVEVESTAALDLIRVLNSPCFMVKSWLVQDQTVLGKDYSNLLIADSLLKTIWFINAPCYGNEALASPKANELTIPEQTATGKGISNPFMAGSLPKTTKPT